MCTSLFISKWRICIIHIYVLLWFWCWRIIRFQKTIAHYTLYKHGRHFLSIRCQKHNEGQTGIIVVLALIKKFLTHMKIANFFFSKTLNKLVLSKSFKHILQPSHFTNGLQPPVPVVPTISHPDWRTSQYCFWEIALWGYISIICVFSTIFIFRNIYQDFITLYQKGCLTSHKDLKLKGERMPSYYG